VSPKNDIDFFRIFSWENILVKSPYYEKGKKGRKRENPHVFPIQENNSLRKKKKTHYPSQYHLIKLLHFSSSLKPPHLKKTL
jgi:hypothetical protein